METYISRIISVFNCKWFFGGTFNTLLSCLWIIVSFKCSRHLVQGGGSSRHRVWLGTTANFPLSQPCLIPNDQPPISLPYLQMPCTWNFILPSVKNAGSPERERGMEKKKLKRFKRGRKEILINLFLDLGKSHLKEPCNVSRDPSN